MDYYLASIYYDPKCSGGFAGVGRLYKDVKKRRKIQHKACENQRMVDENRCVHFPSTHRSSFHEKPRDRGRY